MYFKNMDTPVVQKYYDLVISLVHSSFMLFRNCYKRSCLLRVREVWCMPFQVSYVNAVSSWLFTLSEENKVLNRRMRTS